MRASDDEDDFYDEKEVNPSEGDNDDCFEEDDDVKANRQDPQEQNKHAIIKNDIMEEESKVIE